MRMDFDHFEKYMSLYRARVEEDGFDISISDRDADGARELFITWR